MARAILGPGGQKIRKIRNDSQARIVLGETNNQDERAITIEGTYQQIQTAENFLHLAVMKYVEVFLPFQLY